MLNQEIMQKLKKSNVSRDELLTKERFQELWKSASNAQKKEILDLAGIVRASAYRVGKTGAISAKLSLALSQVLNADPFYVTGESDNRGAYSDASVYSFLQSRGYKKLMAGLSQPKAKRPYTKRVKNDVTEAAESVAAPEAVPAPELTEEEAVILLRALIIRAKTNAGSLETLKKVEALLI